MPRWLPRQKNGGVSSGIQGGWAGPGLLPGGAVSLLCDPTALRKLTDLRVHPRSSWGPSQGCLQGGMDRPSWQRGDGHRPNPRHAAERAWAWGRPVRAGCICWTGASPPRPQCALGTKKTEQVPRASQKEGPAPCTTPFQRRATALQVLVLTGGSGCLGFTRHPRCTPVLPSLIGSAL